MAPLRIILRILWNYIMKNFHEKHCQCDSIIFLKIYSLGSSRQLLSNFCFDGGKMLYFWKFLEFIHKFILELDVLQFFFVRGLMKNKGAVGLFQISQKETFSSLISTKHSVATILALFRKMPLFPFSLDKKIIYLGTQLKGEFTDLFWKLPGSPLFLQAE